MNARPPKTGRGGFTLLELMVVITLMGVMSAVIVVEMRGTFEDALLRTTARRLMSAANVANARAIARGEPHVLTLDLAGHRYSTHRTVRDPDAGMQQIVEEEGPLDERVAIEIREPAAEVEAGGEPGTEEESTEKEVIRFWADGTADAREILLRDRAGGETRLRVSTAIGRLRVVENADP